MARNGSSGRSALTYRTSDVRVAGELEQQIGLAPGPVDVEEERLVGLEVDQRVLGGIGAEPVAVEAAGPAGLVEHDVEQGAAVVGPRQAAARR